MGHSRTYIDGIVIHHSSDYSGTVLITQGRSEVPVPLTVLEQFMAEKHLDRIVSYLEGLDTSEKWVQNLLHKQATELGVG